MYYSYTEDVENLREYLHGISRLQIHLAKMDGCRVDKKICRFNDIVDTAIKYGRLGENFSPVHAVSGLKEVLDACIVGDPMHYEGGYVTGIVYDWMLCCEEDVNV